MAKCILDNIKQMNLIYGINNIRCPEGHQPNNYQLGKSGIHHNQYTKQKG